MHRLFGLFKWVGWRSQWRRGFCFFFKGSESTLPRWPWLCLVFRWIDTWSCRVKCLRAVKQVLNTLWEAKWILGIPTPSSIPPSYWQDGRGVNLGVNKGLEELACPQQLRLHSRSRLLIPWWMPSKGGGGPLKWGIENQVLTWINCPVALTCLQTKLQLTLSALASADRRGKWKCLIKHSLRCNAGLN